MVVSSGGNLGVGDITPAAALTVGNGDLFQVNSSGVVAAGTWQGGIVSSTYGGTGANLSGAAANYFPMWSATGVLGIATYLQYVPGSATMNINSAKIMLGSGDQSTPAATIIRGPAAVGTNVAGASWTFDASNGTGTGGSGSIIWRTAPVAGSSSTSNTMTERMRILPSGEVGIGDTSPDFKLDVEGDVADYIANFFNDGNADTRYGIQIQGGADDASGTTYYVNALDGDGGQVGYISNTAGTFALTDVSDIRTKTNIEDTEIDATSILSGLRVVDFNRLANPEGPKITGFIAQEVQEVYPNIITEGENGYLGITKENLIPVLVKGFQEMDLKINDIANVEEENDWRDAIVSWFSSATNGIGDFFANRVRTKEICLKDEGGETCISRTQLDNLLNNTNRNNPPSYTPPPIPDPEPTPEPTVVEPDPEIEPTTPIPEPETQPEIIGPTSVEPAPVE